MADRKVGIEFYLTAPNVKGQMDEVIKGWDEIIEGELNAKKAHDEFIKSATAGMKKIEEENKLLQKSAEAMMKNIQQQKISAEDTSKQLRELDKEATKVTQSITKRISEWIKSLSDVRKGQKEVADGQAEVTAAIEEHNKAVAESADKILQLTTQKAELAKQINELRQEMIELQKQASFSEEDKARMIEISEETKKLSAELKEVSNQLGDVSATQDKLAETAQGINDITDASEQLNESRAEGDKITEKATETERKGLLETILAFFRKRKELESLEDQIKKVNDELAKLRERQREITDNRSGGFLPAFLGEGADNERRIKELNTELESLIRKQKGLSVQTDDASKKSVNFSAVLGKMKVAAVAAGVAIVSGLTAVGLTILKLGSQNEQVQKQIERSTEARKKAFSALSDALAPVAYVWNEIIADLAESLAKWVTDNSEKIFDFSVKAAGSISFFVTYLKNAFSNAAVQLRYLGAEFQRLGKLAEIAIHLAFFRLESANEARNELKEINQRIRELGDEMSNQIPAFVSAGIAYDNTTKKLKELGLAFFNQKGLTKEQIELIRKLSDEYNKLVSSVSKAITELNIEEAGPITGILIKSELAAKSLEAEAARFVELAKALGKSGEEVEKISSNYQRLVDATRQRGELDALNQILDLSNKIADQVNEIGAQRTGTEVELKFQEQLADINKNREYVRQLSESLKANAEEYSANKELFDSVLFELANNLDKLEQAALDDLVTGTNVEIATKRLKELRKQFDELRDINDEIIKYVDETDNLSDDRKLELLFEFDVNQENLNSIISKISELTDVLGAEVVIPVTTEYGEEVQELLDIREQQHFTVDIEVNPKVSTPEDRRKFFLDKIRDDVSELLGVTTEEFDYLANALGSAYSFISSLSADTLNAQLEHQQRLVDARREAVDALEDDLEREARFKEAGLANDYDLLKKKKENEEALLAEQIAKQQELEEKRAKAQRQQDALNQGSALITASANIWKGFTAITGPFGIALAIAAIAAMFTAFAAQKIKVAQLTRAYKGSARLGETFGELAPGEGYDDRPGTDSGLLVYDRKGRIRGQIGGDEALMKASVSRKHRAFLDDLNRNESKYAGRDLVAELMAATHIDSLAAPDIDASKYMHAIQVMAGAAVQARNQARKIEAAKAQGITSFDVERAIEKALDKQTVAVITYLEQRPTIIDADVKNIIEITAKSRKKIRRK